MTDRLTELENSSIRSFLGFVAANGYLSGRVLDYGCGKQPYRGLVEAAGGRYLGYDRADFPANMSGEDVGGWGTAHRHEDVNPRTVLCTQVIQYVPDVPRLLWEIGRPNTTLVMTYPTNWPEVQDVDLHRFTKAGMERLLAEAGFTILEHIMRASIENYGYEFALGYGVIART